ncbi:cation channel sperm-associated protein subunit epsilon [Exaiptasia diaphana]|uniref:CATSPERE second N-terminal domain-containing protein n=1 Tax=Exaiptasia diaphana TaxID=2652724 RepID=A0A913YFX3_EXADI|nr:cation channel sperm-associated protein subunit epsilon [Exaiptasia diaphana]
MAKESWRSKTSLLHCKQAGLHAISPVKNASMVRYINVVHSPFCYEWYLAHHRIITDETTDTFRVWIVDPLHSSSEEENQTAVLPSSFSAQLSTIFNKFGQEPFINLRSGYRSIPSPINTISKGFNSNTSCWEFIMEEPIVDTQLTVWITGKSIAFHDCFIRDKRIQLLLPKYVFDFDDQIQKVRLIGEGQYPRVITVSSSSILPV